MSWTVNSLRVFRAVAAHGSISAGAAAVGRTPSAVSMTLKQLEADIGRPLFEGERKDRLSATGRFALKEADAVLARFDAAVADIGAFAQGTLGRLAVAAVPSVAEHILPPALVAFREAHPRVALSLGDGDSATVAETVAAGRAEIGFAGPPADDRTLAFAPLFRDRVGLVCRADDALAAGGAPLTAADLAGRTLLTHAVAPSLPAVEPTGSPVEARTVTSALGLVRAGIGVTVLPRLALPPTAADLRYVPLSPTLGGWRTVGRLTRRDADLSPPAEAFIGGVDAVLAALAGTLGEGLERLGDA